MTKKDWLETSCWLIVGAIIGAIIGFFILLGIKVLNNRGMFIYPILLLWIVQLLILCQ